MKVILDPGSTHCQNIKYAMEIIHLAARVKADAVKYQLFKAKPPNLALPPEWMPELVQAGKSCGVEVFASVWSQWAMDILLDCKCNSIKFAYSMKSETAMIKRALDYFRDVYVSGEFMTEFLPETVRLYCIPEYPVPYTPRLKGFFPRFHGFSDHTIGWDVSIEAQKQGCKVLEKHITLDREDSLKTPDGSFALREYELEAMMKAIRGENDPCDGE